MLTRPADLPRRARRAAFALLVLAGPLGARLPLAAQSTPPAAAPVTAADRQALRHDVERLYEVLPTHDGLLLRPRVQRSGVRTIELVGDDISVNGNRLPAVVLREWLGAPQADPVIRLSQLDPTSRRALFDFQRDLPGEASAPPAPAAAPAAPSAPAPRAAPAPNAQGSESDENAEPQESEAPDQDAEAEAAKPRRPHRTSSGSIVRFTDNITVRAGESVEEVTAIAGSVTVDGEVAGDVIAVGGSCTINGRVGGSVTAVGGSAHLGPHAEIGGDVISVGGRVERATGSQIHGSVSEVSAVGHDHRYVSPWVFSPFAGVGRLIETLTKIVLLTLLVCLVLLVARPTVERIALRVGAEPWQSGLTGLLSQLAFLPLLVVITILLLVTIIGCALILLYPFVFIALLIAGLVGYAAVALRLGGWAEERFGWRYTSPYVMALAGIALIEFLPFVGRVLGLIGPLYPLALATRAMGYLVEYVAWTVGFGAVVLDFLAGGGFRRFRRRPEPAPVYIPPAAPAPPPAAAPPPPAPPADPWETR
jgi:hypothetical protein